MIPTWLRVVVYALAVYRLTHLVAEDTITAGLRERLREASHQLQVRQVLDHGTERTEERVGEKPGLALVSWKLATCQWCSGMYLSAGVVLGWIYAASWFNWVALVLALSAVAGILSEVV